MMRSRIAGWQVSFVSLGAIWGCSFWWIKLGLLVASPVDVAFARLLFGAVTLLLIAASTRTALPSRARTWSHLFVLAALLNSAPFILFSYAETRISAVLAGLLNSCTPLATLIVALVVMRSESFRPVIMAGLGTGLLGVLVVLGVWSGFGASQVLGIGACLGAVISYGFGFTFARRYLSRLPDSPVSLATGQVVCGALQVFPLSLAFGHVHAHGQTSPILALAALGILGTGVAYILNFHVVRHAPQPWPVASPTSPPPLPSLSVSCFWASPLVGMSRSVPCSFWLVSRSRKAAFSVYDPVRALSPGRPERVESMGIHEDSDWRDTLERVRTPGQCPRSLGCDSTFPRHHPQGSS